MGSRSLGKEVLQRAIARNFDRSRREASSSRSGRGALCSARIVRLRSQADAANTYFVSNYRRSRSGTLRKAIADASAGGMAGKHRHVRSRSGRQYDHSDFRLHPDRQADVHQGSRSEPADDQWRSSVTDLLREDRYAGGRGEHQQRRADRGQCRCIRWRRDRRQEFEARAVLFGGHRQRGRRRWRSLAANRKLGVASSRVSGNTAASIGGGISVAYTGSRPLTARSAEQAGTYGGGIYARNIDSRNYFAVFSPR